MNFQDKKITAKVERIMYPKADALVEAVSTFYILRCDVGTVKGKLAHIPKTDECLTLEGKWEVSSFNGQPEFIFFHATVFVPQDERSMLKYACEMTKGFGPSMEDKIWEKCGEKWRMVKLSDGIPGLTPARLASFQETIRFLIVNAERAKTVSWLCSIGCTLKMAESAFDKWTIHTIEKVKDDCYILAKLPNYGFADVDEHIRTHFEIGRNDERRVNSCLTYYIGQLSQQNTVVDWNELFAKVSKAIDADPATISDCCRKLFNCGKLIAFPKTMRISSTRDYIAESLVWKFALDVRDLSGIKARQPVGTPFKLDESQMAAVQFALDHSFSIINGGAGCGKCLGRGTPVIMFDFSVKNVEDVKVGDILLGPNGEPKHVTSTTSGREEMFRVTPKKGDAFTCNRSHILSVIHSRKRIRKYTDDAKKPFNVSVDEIVTEMKREHREHLKCWRPGSIQRQYRAVAVDPYFVGLWLGDGTSGGDHSVRIANSDNEVISWLRSFAHRVGVVFSITEPYFKHSCPVVNLTSSLGRVKGSNKLKNAMRSAGLFDGEKHIPVEYVDNSEDVRLSILAGILDSDGYYVNGEYEITQKTESLARGIVFVARSLGFGVTIKNVKKCCCNNGVWGDYWRIIITGDIDRIPCIVERKKAKPRRQIKNPRVSNIKIESIGIGEYFGFTLAEPDGLFLLGDFTVTHNTTLIQAICDSLGSSVQLCAFAGKAAARLKEATGHDAGTIHRMLKFMGEEQGFTLKSLRGQTVILDEASMVSSDLMAEIIKRNPDRFVLVGDEAQLPPVGSGQPFHDLIALKPEIVRTLTTCYRNKEAIFQSALSIRNGITPPPNAKSEQELWVVQGITDPRRAHREVLEAVKRGDVDFDSDIILCCRNGEKEGSNECSVVGFNQDIKDIVNPNPDGSYKITASDRIINTKNCSELDVWNGTTGRCRDFDTDGAMWVDLDFPNGDGEKEVLIPKKQVKDWQLAYALTVHKSQGSQYRKVFFIVAKRDAMNLLTRPMVYTAVTRAKRECRIIGDTPSFSRAIGTVDHKMTVIQELARA